jgi:hypothetical protein
MLMLSGKLIFFTTFVMTEAECLLSFIKHFLAQYSVLKNFDFVEFSIWNQPGKIWF